MSESLPELEPRALMGAAKPDTRRLLFVGAFPPAGSRIYGGMVTACSAILKSSLPSRVDVDPFDTTQISNPPPSLFLRALLAMRRLAAFVWRCETTRPDAVLLFAAVGASLVEKGAMAWYCRARGMGALLFPRGGGVIAASEKSVVTRNVLKVLLGGADKLLCQGPVWQTFATNVCGYSIDNSPIIRNWTATPEYVALGVERFSAHRETKRITVLFVGWLEKSKGVFELLDACLGLFRRYEFEVVFVGDGNARGELERLAGDQLHDKVRVCGWLPSEELRVQLSRGDIFTLPSYAEGLPNAMIEAMAAGLPVVVTSVGSVPDVVTHMANGLLVRPRDENDLASALELLLANAELREQLGRAGHDYAKAAFGLESAADKLVALIDSFPKRRMTRERSGEQLG